ncbi:GSU2403 family nucleotidyltransferase fold protein [Piscinibacter sp.]|uniref:GSU2403 family nucleotidyltransferase fold protein n=1 Tax=Piscinibacter sp. TaxID=1903157 RepID=UPI0039E5ADE7
MSYKRSDFVPFSADSGRVGANLEAAYEQWLDAQQQLATLPVSMYWQRKASGDYLAVKQRSSDPGTTLGPRSDATEARFAEFTQRKAELKQRIADADALIGDRAAQYRALRLPPIPDRQAEILRALDVAELLRNDLLVVGTNAFIAYSLLCNARFPAGVEETEDFDLAWCRGSAVSLARTNAGAPQRSSLMSVLQGVDPTFRLNRKKPYQAVNANHYEVELLMAPSLAPLPKGEAFEPMVSLTEQEWLLEGRPLSVVVATLRQRACPLYVPDPRWMALHKLWLAGKPERNALKKPKDRRQGEVLLSACRYFLADTYPLDIDFVLELPAELRDLFDAWARAGGFDPTRPTA